MSNVLYMCPKCGARLFAAPGGTPIHCPNHPDQLFIQQEEYGGPSFAQKPDDTIDGVMTHGIDPSSTHVIHASVESHEMTSDELRDFYREQYERVAGVRPDMRWGNDRLKEEIEAAEGKRSEDDPEEAPTEDADDEQDADSPLVYDE